MAAIALLLSISSCNGSIPVESHWSVESLYSNGSQIEIPAGHNPGISFLKDSKIAGETGCNRFFGEFRTDGAEISFANMGSTRMMCPQMAFENSYMQALDNVASFEFETDKLILKDKDGNTIVVLKKMDVNGQEN